MRTPDVEAEVTLFRAEDGGRRAPAHSGYRPHHRVLADYQTTGTHKYIGCDVLALGETATAAITFISPDAYPASLAEGDSLEIAEGSHVVGRALVVAVLNASLRRAEPARTARQLPIEQLTFDTIASGELSLTLTNEVPWEAFADYARELLSLVRGEIVDQADSVVARAWSVCIHGGAYWLSFNDFGLGLSIDAKDRRASDLSRAIYAYLLRVRNGYHYARL